MPAPTLLRRCVAGLVAGASALTLALAGPGQGGPAAAVEAPGGLTVDMRGSATPVLSWDRQGGAPTYDVQVDDDPGFGSPDYSGSTMNRRIVPSSALPAGTVYWRVRTRSSSSSSSWSNRSSFPVAPLEVPVPTTPAEGATLQQPEDSPLLRWQASKGATSYTVEVDGDDDFVGASSWTTQSTAFVVPRALAEGDWFWRVRATKGAGLLSSFSPVRMFQISPLRQPVLVSPADTFSDSVEDVVLDWEAVRGAQAYDVQIALDQNFQNYVATTSGVKGTRWSPKVTINNDEFWWRVRAIDTNAQSTPWTESRFSFKRQWLDQATPVWPLGTSAEPGLQGPDTTYFEWTPTQHATSYQLEVSASETFSNALRCQVAGTTYVPRLSGSTNDCLAQDLGTATAPRFWRVRAIDRPYPDSPGLPGVWSRPQVFQREAQPAPGSSEGAVTHATGLKVSLTGTGASDPARGCESDLSVGYPGSDYTAPSVCGPMRATPVFSWDRYPGATSYTVWFAQDENFTTTELQAITTRQPMLALDDREPSSGKGPWTLPESEAGRPYFWYVQPCTPTECAMRPDSLSPGVTGAASFQKVSPAATGLSSSPTAANDITFHWHDYVDTNTATTSLGETGQQTAQNYRIQVDDEPSFTAPLLDQAEVDQTTYTAADRLYPEGRLYWRVQALDAGDGPRDTVGHGLTWSETATLTKQSPAPTLNVPTEGERVPGTTPFQWADQPFAVKYEVEVYRNGDTALSPTNRVLTASVGTASYAPNRPLPASSSAYLWRVRRIDASGNPGPWSAPRRFFSTGAAPELLIPAGGAFQGAHDAFFQWSDVAGAASYRIVFRKDGAIVLERETTATAYASSSLADGDLTWTVTALDSAGQPLGTSPVGRFRVDGASPSVISVKPRRLTASSNVSVAFSEAVRGVGARSVRLTRNGRAINARVTTAAGGTGAVLNPARRLRRGTYRLSLTSAITDTAGNQLTATTRTLRWGR